MIPDSIILFGLIKYAVRRVKIALKRCEHIAPNKVISYLLELLAVHALHAVGRAENRIYHSVLTALVNWEALKLV